MNKIHNHPHPGVIVKNIFNRNNISAQKAAELLGVTRTYIYRLFNCKVNISPEMAMRLSIVFGTTVERWLNLRINYDIWYTNKHKKKEILKQVTPLKKVVSL